MTTGTQDTPLLIARPGESILFTLDFTNILADDGSETITAVSGVTVDTPTGAASLVVGDTAFSGAYGQVRLTIPGSNTDGHTYHVTMTIVTTSSNTRIDCGDLQVQSC